MKNLERIAIRDAVSQMLADCGVNSQTLVAMLKNVIEEKAEKAVKSAFQKEELERLVSRIASRELEKEISVAVRRVINCTVISITHNRANLGGDKNAEQ